MTTAAASRPAQASQARPGLRLVPAPRWDPPETGEPALSAAAALPAAQGSLALAFTLPNGLPEQPLPPRLRLLPGGLGVADPVADDALSDAALERAFGPQPTARAALPEPRAWAARIAQAVVEVIAGDRPATQLARWTADDVYQSIRRRVQPAPPSGRQGPARRAAVRSVRVCEPADGVVEASAVVSQGARHRAVALRLEGLDGRWQCTALQLG